MPIHRLEEMTWQELDLLPRDVTAVFLPVSPIEEHGPHLPLGVDCMTATALAAECADEFVARQPSRHAVICPLLAVGVGAYRFIGSVLVGQRTVRNLVRDWGDSLARYGFRHLVVTSGHGAPGHIVALEEACDLVTSRYRVRHVQMVSPLGPMVCRYFAGGYGDSLREAALAAGDAGDAPALAEDVHAGFFETSLLLHLAPHLVRDGYRRLPAVVAARDAGRLSTEREATTGLGYLGHPARARAAFGEAAMKLARREIGDLLDRMAAGEDVASSVHCPLGRIPLLWTNFWPALSAAALAVATLLLIR